MMRPRLRQYLLAAILLLGSAARAEDAAPPAEPRFDVAVDGVPARAFFAGLVDGTPYNVILEPGVSGTITLRLKNVTVKEALDAVAEAYGYAYRKIGGGYVVLPPTLQTRLYQVDYLDLERNGSSRTRVTSGQMPQGSGRRNGSVTSSEAFGAEAERDGGNDSRQGSNGQTGTTISTRSESDFWPALEASLRGLLPPDGGRSVATNAQSGVIAVRATPREQRDVQEYLARIQSVMTRQVILEAKILEVELSSGFQAGINWAAVARDGGRSFFGGQSAPQQGFGTDLFTPRGGTVTVEPGNPITGFVGNTLGGAFTLAVDAGDFNAFVEALETQGKTRVLSSPRVSTLNNQKAVIKAGSDEFFVTNVSSNTVVGTSSATNRDVELTPFFSGIALDVTPQVSAEGQVILHIHTTVSDVTEKVKALKVAGVTDELPLAFSQVRESDSVVRAKSGQVIVIGGLMRTSRDDIDYQVPLLGDIPALGTLFKSQRRQDRKTELVILLRPVVVDSDEQWQALVAAPLQRATALDPKAGVGVP